MPDVLANGVRLNVQRLSAGEESDAKGTVVFLHGLVVDDLSCFYYTLANAVAKANADVILYDLRGHGRSERPPTGYRLSDSVADLEALLDALDLPGTVHLVGNSYGGVVALAFAIAHPGRVASLVLIDAPVPLEGTSRPAPGSNRWDGQILGLLESPPDRYGELAPRIDPRLNSARMVAASMLEASPAPAGRRGARLVERVRALVEDTTLVPDVRSTPPMTAQALAAVSCPVLALYGERSDTVYVGHRLDDLLQRSTLIAVPDSTHWVLLEEPAYLREVVLSWLAAPGDPSLPRRDDAHRVRRHAAARPG